MITFPPTFDPGRHLSIDDLNENLGHFPYGRVIGAEDAALPESGKS